MNGMNPYQKSAMLVIRLFAAYFVATCFLKLAIDAMDKTNQTPPWSFSAFPFIRDTMWAIFGLFLWLYAKPLGRFLGKGLD